MNSRKKITRNVGRVFLTTVVGLITAMWIYALGFAPKDSVNRFEDRQWAKIAQQRCLIAEQIRMNLADYRIVDDLDSQAIGHRGDIVDLATDTIEDFVKQFRSELPTDAKGIALVTLWLNDYEIYIADRRKFAVDLRNGINLQFSETPLKGIPISEKIGTFAADNQMPKCKPPMDLSI